MQNFPTVYFNTSTLLTPLGLGSEDNFKQVFDGKSGIQIVNDPSLFNEPLPLSQIDPALVNEWKLNHQVETRFDGLLLKCADDIQQKCSIDLSSKDVIIILSTTKGNIELLEQKHDDEQLLLSYSASLVQQYLKNPNKPIIVSNACISGISSLIVAKRLLQNEHYKHALVIGCDVLSKFVITGFNSFHALSKNACKPFDIDRSGITLGEAAAAVVLSSELKGDISIEGGCISNDANHISGPSKTGEELSYCINQSLLQTQVQANEIDFISAHGTATSYNDEMESKAFELSNLNNVSIFSLKAVYGHTLGAAGLLETIISAECLRHQTILASKGFEVKGVSGDITINQKNSIKRMHYALKTASGFGGCNAALVLKYLN